MPLLMDDGGEFAPQITNALSKIKAKHGKNYQWENIKAEVGDRVGVQVDEYLEKNRGKKIGITRGELEEFLYTAICEVKGLGVNPEN